MGAKSIYLWTLLNMNYWCTFRNCVFEQHKKKKKCKNKSCSLNMNSSWHSLKNSMERDLSGNRVDSTGVRIVHENYTVSKHAMKWEQDLLADFTEHELLLILFKESHGAWLIREWKVEIPWCQNCIKNKYWKKWEHRIYLRTSLNINSCWYSFKNCVECDSLGNGK